MKAPPDPDVFAVECPSREVFEHLTARWSGLVLVGLSSGALRFSQLRRRVGGISEKMLSQTLAILEADGFLERTVFPEVPPRVEYALTDLGREAAERLAALVGWIEQSLPRVQRARRGSQGTARRRGAQP
jgi:DNA-binding HxlR family transcriptional regulator